MNRKGQANYETFPYLTDENGNNLCRTCRKPLNSKRKTFCNQRCIRDFFMKTDWKRVQKVIYARDGGICMKCGKEVSKDNFHVDHIVPVSKGGDEWDLENLELSCPECNLKKGAKEDC